MSIVEEAPNYLQVFSDGSAKRFAPEIAPTSEEASGGYKSKDVFIDLSNAITGRIFLPDIPGPCTSSLPVLFYFHGGGFCIGSTTRLGYHHFLGDFAVVSHSIVLSVDYRLAPEHCLPIAYDDCYSSLEWLCSQVSNEPWLKQADISRVFLYGDSAGGNIVHQKERADGTTGYVAMNDMFWKLSIPDGSNRDYFGCNFKKQEVSEAEWREFPAVTVYVAGLGLLKERGVMYAEFLQRKEVKRVKLVKTENKSHVFHVFHPKSEATCSLQQQMSEFMKNN
ncbi:hypothetical protein CXB51_014361 [Gossypium anomalum]|uniref:Alpha/beta hydrolase fold-3 domain-containing protein n=1 Tax=Gossypium anomalum TaxID=47600 RepID=A0A8J5YRG1_9ROSI|nr:hypothetical protein CXB51_014361 [Gossypium anomalum]